MGEAKGCSHWANSLLVIGFGFEFTRGVGSGLTEFLTARFRLQMHSDGDERGTAATRLMAPTLDLEADGATGGAGCVDAASGGCRGACSQARARFHGDHGGRGTDRRATTCAERN